MKKNKLHNLMDFFNKIKSQQSINGAFLIAEDGNIYKGAIGEANLFTNRKLNVDTLFNLASVSKPITAIGIMLLAQDERLSFDDSIEKWIPELPYKGITVRNLLNHTSGLPDYLDLFAEHWDSDKIATNRDLLDLLIKYKPEKLFEPNERMEYGNTGYIILALIIEKVTGLKFEEYMRTHVFIPTGMKETKIYSGRIEGDELDNIAYGYVYDVYKGKYVLPVEFKESKFVAYLDGLTGDGGIYSSVEDLYKLDRALRNGQLLSDEILKEAYSPSSTKVNEVPMNYGFGWILQNEEKKGKAVWHSGGWPGYSTYFKRFIDEDIVIIFLRNKENDFDYEQAVLQTIEQILFEEPFNIPIAPELPKAIKLEANVLKKHVGEYKLDDSQDLAIKVTIIDESLFIEFPGSMKLELHATSSNEFFLRGLSITIKFEELDKQYFLTVHDQGEFQTAKRI